MVNLAQAKQVVTRKWETHCIIVRLKEIFKQRLSESNSYYVLIYMLA